MKFIFISIPNEQACGEGGKEKHIGMIWGRNIEGNQYTVTGP